MPCNKPFPCTRPLPLWACLADGKTVVYDRHGKRQHEWAPLEGDIDGLRELVGELPSDTVFMQPWDFMFMKNPVPHEVRGGMRGVGHL